MVRVLLTGAAGFIGSAIAGMLRTEGHDVVGLDALLNTAHGRRRPVSATPDLVVGDVRDEHLLCELLVGVDAVCHQAAMVGLGVHATDAPRFAAHNVLGTATVLSAMARCGVTRLVQASSMVVYGEGRYRCAEHGRVRPRPRTAADLAAGRFDPGCPRCGRTMGWERVPEDAPVDPRSTYAATKLAQEHLASSWAAQVGGCAVSLRYHNVFGPRMPRDTPYCGVAAIFRSELERGRPPRVLEDGRQMRDFVHVCDVARANVLALEHAVDSPAGLAPEVLVCNVCSGEPHSVAAMADALADAIGGPAPVIVGGGRPGDVRHVVADPGHARRMLGFSARVPFATGVANFAATPMREPVIEGEWQTAEPRGSYASASGKVTSKRQPG